MQEIDIKNGKLLLQWVSADHVPYSDSHAPMQQLGLFVSWGGLSYFSEFSPSGKLLFNAELSGGSGTYRAYRLPWNPGS